MVVVIWYGMVWYHTIPPPDLRIIKGVKPPSTTAFVLFLFCCQAAVLVRLPAKNGELVDFFVRTAGAPIVSKVP